MAQFVEMLTPILTVMQFLDDIPLKTGTAGFGARASFDKDGFQSFYSRLQYVRNRFGQRPHKLETILHTPVETDDLTGVRCAWFISPEQPLVVDSELERVPPSVKLTRGSRVYVSLVVHQIRPMVLGFLPKAIQIVHLAQPSDLPIPFSRLPDGYRYRAAEEG
jgi:hypothetical protein